MPNNKHLSNRELTSIALCALGKLNLSETNPSLLFSCTHIIHHTYCFLHLLRTPGGIYQTGLTLSLDNYVYLKISPRVPEDQPTASSQWEIEEEWQKGGDRLCRDQAVKNCAIPPHASLNKYLADAFAYF